VESSKIPAGNKKRERQVRTRGVAVLEKKKKKKIVFFFFTVTE